MQGPIDFDFPDRLTNPGRIGESILVEPNLRDFRRLGVLEAYGVFLDPMRDRPALRS
jgi:hypothetical protein